MNNWGELVETHFGYLRSDFGFSKKLERHDPEFFGNRQTIFASENLEIELNADRGRLGVYIHPQSWNDAYGTELIYVLAFLKKDKSLISAETRENAELPLSKQLTNKGRLLRDNFHAIQALFTDADVARIKEDFRKFDLTFENSKKPKSNAG